MNGTPSDPVTECYCPNCLTVATKRGNEITCEKCDATYLITRKKESKLQQIRIGDRLSRLETAVFPSPEVFAQTPSPETPPETPPESEPKGKDQDKENGYLGSEDQDEEAD